MTLIAKGLGDDAILGKRTPDLNWLRELMNRAYGGDAAVVGDQVDGPKRIEIPDADERLAPRED
jgi:hypothetical protein